jgi:hypothetical protein
MGSQGHPTGSVTTIGGPNVDGTDWSSNAFFVSDGARSGLRNRIGSWVARLG